MKQRKSKVKISEQDIKNGLNFNVFRREGRAHMFILFILLIKKDATDWNGKLIRHVNLDKLARHHIFPKEFLEENLEIDDPTNKEILINNLANVTFIDENINSEIGSDSPEQYMPKYIEAAKKHFIPKDENLWKLEQYETFLEYRIKELHRTGKELFKEVFD